MRVFIAGLRKIPVNEVQNGEKMILFLLEMPVFLLLAGKGKVPFLISLCVYLAFCSGIFMLQKNRSRIFPDIHYPIPSILITSALSLLFYFRWNSSRRIIDPAGISGNPPKQICLQLASFLGLLAVFGVDHLLKVMISVIGRGHADESRSLSAFEKIAYIFLSGFLIISLNSQCSPIYAFNDWDDANTIFTVGKAILKGFVPYKDLYEQKGPLMFFLQVPGAAISFDSFTGIWIVEAVFVFIFLYFSYKTAELLIDPNILIFTPILAFLVYGSYSFSRGNSAEEYCLAFTSYALYAGVKAIKKKRLPNKREYILIGITSACVLWIKYSMLGIYLGWYLIFLVTAVKNRQVREFVQGTGWILLGIFMAAAPILVYFAVNSSLRILFEVYFVNNITLYTKEGLSLIDKIGDGLKNIVSNNFPIFLLSVSGLFWLCIRDHFRYCALYAASFLGMFLIVYHGGYFHQYSSLIFGIFAVPGLCCLSDLSAKISFSLSPLRNISNHETVFGVSSFFLSLWLMTFFSSNMFYLKYEKEDLMQYKMKTVIEKSDIKDPTILNWTWGETGVNTVMGLIPDIRFFCWNNNPNLEIEIRARETYLREKAVDFIIYYSNADNYPEFENYQYAGSIDGTFNYKIGYYHFFIPEES